MDDNEVTTETPSQHVIHVEFKDDHSIEGMSIAIRGVTPLQIFSALYFLQRAANRLEDIAEASRMTGERATTLEIARTFPANLKGN